MSIQVFNDINESHMATGYTGRTDLPAFHIFSLEDTYPSTRQVMPPYRFNFYQVVLFEQSDDAELHVNTNVIRDLSDTLSFASPAHVLAWIRGAAQRGYIVYFKDSFLEHYPVPVLEVFPFFRMTEMNMLQVTGVEQQTQRDHFVRLFDMFHSTHPYRVQMLHALLLELLFDCKRLYDTQQYVMTQSAPHDALNVRFQHLVNQHYLVQKTVQEYAQLLAVSPDYLGQAVKLATGKTAHQIIVERILLEAKKLLVYTDLSIGEIADYLGYAEPTHFGRFFRRHINSSPLVWRRQQHTLGYIPNLGN
ncbi:MAG: helix-turn-helix domain-containing protein [Chloroflexota bacterium]